MLYEPLVAVLSLVFGSFGAGLTLGIVLARRNE
jgi:hypothetical protein